MFSQFSSEPNVDLVEIKNLEEYKGRRKTISKEDSSSEELQTFEKEALQSEDEFDEFDPEIPYKRSIFHLIGIVFLCLSLLFAITCLFATFFSYNKIGDQSMKWVFGPLFGCFLASLFLCLCCTYYFGAPEETWEVSDPNTNLIKLNFTNVVVLIGVIVEFVQICSFSFNKYRLFGGLSIGDIHWIAVPVDNNTFFGDIFWVIFFIAFTPWIFMIITRIILYLYELYKGPEPAELLTEKFRPKFHVLLWFLVNVLYFPVVGTMMAGANCTYTPDRIIFDANTTISCFEGQHIGFLITSIIGLIIYFPAASFAQSQVSGISDIKFKPRVIFINSLIKFFLVIFTVFFSSIYYIYYSCVLISNLLFLFLNLFGSPCFIRWVNRMRTIFLSLCLWATISAGVVSTWIMNNQYSMTPVIVLLVGWGIILIGFPTLFIVWYRRRGNSSISNKMIHFLGIQPILDKFF